MQNGKKTDIKPKNSAVEAFKQSRPKGFMRNRLIALIIDFIVVALLCQLAFTLLGVPDWGQYLETQELVAGLPATDPLVLERMMLYQECFLVTLGIGVAYEGLMLVFLGASLGKLLLGLRVVSAKEDGHFLVGKLRLILRCVVKALSIYLLSALPFVFLCLTAFGNPEGRSGFDTFAGTKVMDTRSVA